MNPKYKIKNKFRINKSICLDKNQHFHYGNIRIIGQINNQMIACLLREQRLLLIFDQHAVHERIRYEKILKSSFNNDGLMQFKQIKPPFQMTIPKQLYQQLMNGDLLEKFQKFLNTLIEIPSKSNIVNDDENESTILIKQIPLCFHHNFHHQGLFQDFLIDTIRYFDKQTNENLHKFHMTPFLVDQIRQQACHGAIRFNEPLNNYECSELIQALTLCRSAFRCAHGRILVKLLLDLSNDDDNNDNNNNNKQIYEKSMEKIWQKIFENHHHQSILKIETITEKKNISI